MKGVYYTNIQSIKILNIIFMILSKLNSQPCKNNKITKIIKNIGVKIY